MVGKVYIVGAGPGDFELLTLKAYRILKEADIVLYDRLVGSKIINEIKKMGKKLVYVGKNKGEKGNERQQEINRLMESYAKDGKTVVRLKGGDPLIFGRLFDEIEHLSKKDIPFEIIPGVSSVNGVPAYANIPLTHPEHGQMLVVVTGRDAGKVKELIDKATIVVLMGGNTAKDVAKKIIEMGIDPKVGVAIIEKGTLEDQRVTYSTLEELSKTDSNFDSPALMIVGRVVDFAPKV